MPWFMRHANNLFRLPIASVNIIDRRPQRDDFDGEYHWDYRPFPQKFNTWEEELSHIPWPVRQAWNHVHGPAPRYYRTAREAKDDLNKMALAYGIATRTRAVETASV